MPDDAGTQKAPLGVPLTSHQPDRSPYDTAFYDALEEGATQSAAVVTDLVVSKLAPRSIVDLGCATGRWLAAFRQRGVADTLGVDGPWVEPAQLVIPPETFRPHDLVSPVRIDRRFDLAVCLETAEHLPLERGAGLVDDLVRLAPVILFSAAIPGQVGTGHINEQWPSYWRDLFASRGYDCHTALREQLWHREEVEVWYRQNLLVFSVADLTEQVAQALHGAAASEAPPLDLVHPDLYARERRNIENWSLHAANLEAQLDEARRARDAISGELDEARRARDAISGELDEARRARDAISGELDEARRARDAISNELNCLQARLENRVGRRIRVAAQKVFGHLRSDAAAADKVTMW